MNLVTLARGSHRGLSVQPRWPARHLRLDPLVLSKLQLIQAQLPAEIELILTRGFEHHASRLGAARKQFRRLGMALFRRLYPGRQHELHEIFGCNGHDLDGRHVDVSFRLHGQRIRLLPLGVFTPPGWQRARRQKHASALTRIHAALQRHGFRIHPNQTESLQIHCDLISASHEGDGAASKA